MVATTVLLVVSITDTEFDQPLATYTFVWSALTTMPVGREPTAIVLTTVLVVVSMTDTLFDPWLAT